MRMRVAVTAVGLALLAAALLRQASPGASARPSEPAPPPVPVTASAVPPPPPSAPARDVFSYVGSDARALEPAALPTPMPAPPSLAEAPATPSGPRLVGLVRQGGTLRAALVIDGEMVVAQAGDRAGAYTVVAIDEDQGVTLKDATGTALTLPASPP